MTATVTAIHKPSILSLTDEQLLVIVQRDAALRAVFRVQGMLEADLKRATSTWKDERTEATKFYREHLRDEEREALRESFAKLRDGKKLTDRDRQNLTAIAEHYYAACDGLEHHDEVLADGKADKDKRAKQIEKFRAAHRELSMQGRDGNSDQLGMPFEPKPKPGVAMTEGTAEIVYAALLKLDSDKAALDDAQRELLRELGSTGVKTLDLGINAAEAVETDVKDQPGDEPDDDDDDIGIPTD